MKKYLVTFSWVFITFLILGAFLLILLPKGELVLLFNSNYSVSNDFFFKYATHLGDGLMFAVLAVILLFVNRRLILDLALTGIVQGLMVLLFKRLLFPDAMRPRAFFGDSADLHFIEGVSVHSFGSFPSGHTATAFGLAAFLAFTLLRNASLLQCLVFVLAAIAGLSRMYLLQHFFMDVYVGALFGVFSAYAGISLSTPVLGLFAKKKA